MTKLTLILGIVVSLCTLTAGVVGVNEYFAKAAELELVALRLDQKILQDKCDWIQQRIWQLEDRYNCTDMPPSVREEYRQLKHDHETNCRQPYKPREDH